MAKRKNPAAAADPEVVLAFKREQAEKDIEEITAWLKDVRIELYQRTIKTGKLIQCYKILGDTDKMCKTARELIRLVKSQSYKIKKMRNPKHADAISKHFHTAYITLAPYSFMHFLVCMEWNYPQSMKFYSNRICVMGEWAHQLERLEMGELDLLGLSAPPRSGKTGIGELFLSWIIGRHPDKSTLFATHTNGMAVKAMGDVYNLITDPRRGWNEVFPNITVEKSQEYLWMDLSPKDTPNTYKTIYFRGIDGSFAGVLEASAYIYCDDLIRDITEAMNPDRLENAWTKYGTDISQRRVDDTVKELHIATRWSTRDVLSRLEEENEDNPRAKFIKVPGLNEQGESNFMFPHRPMTKEHFEKLRSKMDEVSFECIIQQNPIERDGLLFTAGDLKPHEFDFLPDENPDEVVFYCDVAFGGGDFLSMPIASVYDMDGFINEVVHHNGTKEITVPLVVDAIIRNKCTRGEFEGNNGGNMYADLVQEELKRRGYRCAVSSRRAPTNKSKLDRILACVPEIKGNITDGSGYTLHFRSDKSIVRDEMYRMYKKHLMAFNQSAKYQGKQKDDAADSTAGLVTNVLSENAHMGRISTFSRSLLF